jgi:hypothetical protein
MILEHLGKLHPYEHFLVLVLAFGPVLLLAVTIYVARKRQEQEDDDSEGPENGM